MVLHGEHIVSSCHATNNTQRPRLDWALPEVVYAPASTDAPDQTVVAKLLPSAYVTILMTSSLFLSTRLF